MRKFKLFFACLLMAVLSIGQVWGAETLVYTLDGTTTGGSNGYATESDIEQSEKSWKVTGNTTTDPWRIGGKSIDGVDRTMYNVTGSSFSENISKVTVTTGATASSLSINSISLIVSTAQNGGGTVTNSETKTSGLESATLTFERPSGQDWSNKYFKIVFNVTRTSNSGNGYITFSNAKFYTTGGSSNPTISVDPESATYGVNDAATALSVTATASDGDLSYEWYSNSSESTAGATKVAETETYTPSTSDAGTTYYYCIVTDANGSATSGFAAIEVKAKHNIIFDTDLKSIENVSVMVGETYNITETIEAALIASCTYTKFEGWTTATSIADASVKPSLVSSVTMSTADVTLKPVFSVTTGGGGSSEKTAHLTESEMRTQLNSSATGYSTTTETSYDDTSDGVEWAGKFSANAGGYWVQLRQNATPAYLKISADGNISEVKVTVTSANNKSGGQYDMTSGYNNFTSSVNLYLSTENVAGSENANVVATAATGTGISYIELTLTPSSADNSELYLISSGGCRVWLVDVTYSTGGGGTTTYSLDAGCAAPGQCVAPTFDPGQGTYDAAQSVELATTTDEADIYYTTNGNDPEPGEEGTSKYTSAISVTQNTTIKAIAIKNTWTNSEVAEGAFKIRYAQPTFSVTAGEYSTAQNVTISAAGADAIYYTVDGADPAIDPENLYNGSTIEIKTAGTHTIKAIAVKDGYETSPLATAEYIMNLPYGSIAEFIAGEPTTAKSLTLTNAIITGVSGTTIYIQDETAGIMIYGLSELPENAAPNHSISGTIKGTYTLFKHQHELENGDLSDVTISTSTVARPTISEFSSLSDAYAKKPMMLVTLTEKNYSSYTPNNTLKNSYAMFGGEKIYNTFLVFSDATVWPESSVSCDITGIVLDYNGTMELLPVFASDIVADADAAAPVFTPEGGATEGEAVQVDLNSYVTIAAADANHSVDVDQVQITSTDPVSVTAVSSRDFYRNTSVTKWYYGNSASASYNITIEGVTTQGNVVAQVGGVDAISAKENDEVHILITPNTHFELATITVNGNDPDVVSAGTEYSFEMPAAAVTIAVTWNEDAKATLTFAKGEATGTEDAPTAITDYVGETTQLPANPFTYNGYKFIGWSCDGGTTKLAAGTDYVLAENKAFVAQWAAIPTFNDADHEWQLATSLEAGNYYVIGSASQDKTASKTITSGYMSELDTEIEDGVIAYDALNANTAIFLLGGNSTDGWTLTEVTTDDVLGTTANKNVSWNAGTQVWAISIAEGGNATIGGTSRILHNAANTGKRFTTYTSDLSVSMLLPQLYVWAEKVFKLRYDANGGEDAPDAQPAVNGQATVTNDQPTKEDKIFNGWNTTATGDGDSKAAGDVIDLSSADVTLFAQWRDPNTYTISYNANGGTLMEGKSVIAPEDVTEGEEYSVKANVYEKEGKIFTGWQYGANIYNANDELLPTEDIEFIAQWSDPNITDYVLVTNINQLKNGDKVYIVAAATGNAMGAQYSTTYRQRVEIEKTADKSHVITTGTEPVELTLGTTDGSYYTFNDGTGYLYANSTSANNIGTQEDLTDAGKWTITIDAEGNTTIVSQGGTQYNKLNYNASQPRFAAYKNAQQAVVLYKKLETIRENGVAPGVWGTICPKKEIAKAEGASFFQISYVEYHSGVPYKVFYDEIAEGENLVAGQPYLFQADENATAIKGIAIGEDATIAINDHGFKGVLENETISVVTADVENYRYYIVYNNEIRLCGEGQFLIRAERAYLDMSDPNVEKQVKAPIAGRRRVALTNNAPQVATGMDELNASEAPVKVMIDGKFYILRGEKMYDATGKLVK